MAIGQYARGSEWRRWDLQVHTPHSALNNGFGHDFLAYTKILLERALASDIAVIGITDYFSIAGYKSLREVMQDEDVLSKLLGEDKALLASKIRIFPNVELRTSTIVTGGEGGDQRVNFHVIFSDEIDPQDIEDDFLREIKFTAISNPDSPDERWPITPRSLEALGKKLKSEHPEFADMSDEFVGMMQAIVSHEDVTQALLDHHSRFKDQYLLLVPADEDLSRINWDGQGHHARKLLLRKSHMFFSANAGTREFALGQRHGSRDEFEREFGKRKACVHGSDAHDYGSLFEPALQRYLWIKADPTFQGLRQLLHEPDSRVYIGAEPPALTRRREFATKYVDRIAFLRTPHAEDDVAWFAGEIPLNQGLVAIIGNKGSGKSALADVLGLIGNTRAAAYFSFLTKERFLNPKSRYGEMFEGRLDWCSARTMKRLLADSPDTTSPELIKYIPQNYLETVCTELREHDGGEFDRELMDVIFSHVSVADRLGKRTLTDLVTYVTGERQATVGILTGELQQIDTEIVRIEAELAPSRRSSLEGELAQKEAELQALNAARPGEIPKPESEHLQEQARAAALDLEALNARAMEIEQAIALEQEVLRMSAQQVAAADRMLVRLSNFERQYASVERDSAEDLAILELNLSELVELRLNREGVNRVRNAALSRTIVARQSVDATNQGSLASQWSNLQREIAVAKQKLDEPARKYEAYRAQLAEWRTHHDKLVGAPDSPGSKRGIEKMLSTLDELPVLLDVVRRRRLAKCREIFAVKADLLADYRRLYSPVQQFIDDHPVSRGHGGLQFSATIGIGNLVDGMLEMIHQGRKGSFQRDKEGRERLDGIVKSSDFSTAAGIETFLGELEKHIGRDMGAATQDSVRLTDQLRQGVEPKEFYDFVYGLSYLQPRFELQWQGKNIEQLSPGERGNLLLIFYLLIDKRDVPLILDQPEENLDNQTIAKTLVPAIKYAKDRRQIVVVTHNPNLAVVCDADQIICARMNKEEVPWIAYESGSIESPHITQVIVDVLEGTKPAFDHRDAVYEVLET